jgi:hypothetical protein
MIASLHLQEQRRARLQTFSSPDNNISTNAHSPYLEIIWAISSADRLFERNMDAMQEHARGGFRLGILPMPHVIGESSTK